jgi:hypothetical protein
MFICRTVSQFGFLVVLTNEVPLHCMSRTDIYILQGLTFYRKYSSFLIEVLCRIHCVTLNTLNSFIQQSSLLVYVVIFSCHS